MTPITCAKPSPPKGRSPSSPTTHHVRSNIRSTSISMPSAISSNAASQSSSNSAASRPASKKPLEITAPSSLSQPSSYGCDKCPHHLGVVDRQHDFSDHVALGEAFVRLVRPGEGIAFRPCRLHGFKGHRELGCVVHALKINRLDLLRCNARRHRTDDQAATSRQI